MKRNIIKCLILGLFLLTTIITPVTITLGSTDTYSNYAELSMNQQEGIDYRVTTKDRISTTEVIGIHGGGIEPGTSELVNGIADTEYDSYLFEGIKPSGNSILHITATHFDEPRALNLTSKATTTLSIHGASGDTPILYIGGRDTYMINKFMVALKRAGFNVQFAPSDLAGTDISNICNRNTKGAGVQFEMTTALRKSMFNDFSSASARASSTNDKFKNFINTVRSVLRKG